MKNFPKICPCCKTTYTAESWRALRLDGQMDVGMGDVLEFRTCPCHNTMTIDVSPRIVTPPATGWSVLGVRMSPGAR